jgi:AcrR family transcriptional regulator
MPEPIRGRPRTEPRHEQQERIVRAARVAFSERGYDAVTLSSIAVAADVSRAVVYDVVGSKDRLLGAVADQVADELIAAVDERFSRPLDFDQPLADMVRDDVSWFVELIASEPSYRATIQLAGRLAGGDDDPAARARRRIEDRIDELHRARAAAYGLERNASARVLAVVMLGILESVSVRVGEDGWPAAAVAALVGEFAAGGYLRSEMVGATERFDQQVAD